MKKTILGIVTTLMCCILVSAFAIGCKEPAQAAEETAAIEETANETITSEEATEENAEETVEESAITEESTNTEEKTIAITSGFDHKVTINKPVKTVASGLSVATQLLKILNMEEQMVAIDAVTVNQPYLYGKLSELPVTYITENNWYDLDFEMIVELDPDVFVTGIDPMREEEFNNLAATLEPEIPCIALSFDTPEEIYESVEMLGELFDKQHRAQEYIDFFKSTINMISERIPIISDDDKPTVYYEWMPPYFTFNKDVIAYQTQIDIAGGVNIAADMDTIYGTVDPEFVIERNPEVIVATSYEVMGMEKTSGYDVDDDTSIKAFRDSIMERSELENVQAIVDGRVHVLDMVLSVTSNLGYVYLAKWLHPEFFEDIDPQAVHQEYLTDFLGVDFDLDERGIFAYPEPQ